MNNLIIAVDGYSSTGKSTFAKLIASKLSLIFLDSGAIYRAITLYALEHGLILSDGEIIKEKLKVSLEHVEVCFKINSESGKSETFLNGNNVELRIRLLDVSSNVSVISTIDFVRDYVDEILRGYGVRGGVVADGRDIGTVVFPHAQLKIFMTADAKIRAQRRVDELLGRGEKADFDEIYNNVIERDYIDSHRDIAPLRKAEDAIELDNSYMTIEDQMVWLDHILKERFPDQVL